MILVIDNYDSFIYNIVQYIGEFYPDVRVFRNDKLTVEEALAMEPDGIVISPGPGRPEDGGISLDLIRKCGDIPLFGVCLGHQSITQAYGGDVVSATTIMHGKSSAMTHKGSGIFAGLTNPIKGIRYHSLVAKRETFPTSLEVTAESDDGEIMGLKVKEKDIYGIQFHPESILTEEGKKIIKNFVDIVLKKEDQRIELRIKDIITRASEKQDLNQTQAEEMMRYIMNGKATQSQIGAYLMALKMKGESAEEIAGSAKAMFEVASHVHNELPLLSDTCGTGGDHSGTFNISTATAFVAAGAGIPIAKHGNRSITSNSGSADVLEELGIDIQLTQQDSEDLLRSTGFTFMFAPLYHPAMKNVMPVRRQLGVRTIFNILGPIVNPAGVKHHVMGVFKPELLPLIADVFLRLGHEHSLVVHGYNGLDEASINGPSQAKEIRNNKITDLVIDPASLGLSGDIENLKVSNAQESAAMILAILQGQEKGDPRKAVVLNAALVLYVTQNISLEEAVQKAEESIDSGAALQVLNNVRKYAGRA